MYVAWPYPEEDLWLAKLQLMKMSPMDLRMYARHASGQVFAEFGRGVGQV